MHVKCFSTPRLAVFLLMLLILTGCQEEEGNLELELTAGQLEWIGQRIFLNECAAKEACLVHWNVGEAFPSLGIGHFIWYPAGVDGPFVESFPKLFAFLRQQAGKQGVTPPVWLQTLEPFVAPWPDRGAFLEQAGSQRLRSLRTYLAATKGAQAAFMFERARASLGRVLDAAPVAERRQMRRNLMALASTAGGTYALIDYVNFKGEGLAPRERYNGQGWGLLQVLQQMPRSSSAEPLERFRQAAATVLKRRAELAPAAIEREQWLAGWLKRIETYKEPDR